MKRFQASLSRSVSVEVCAQLPDFKLTLMRIQPLAVSEGGPGPEPAGGPGMDGSLGQRDWAYVLHTSGTTGPPKTVRVPHECILPNILHLRWVSCGLGGPGFVQVLFSGEVFALLRSLFQISADDVLFLASPLTFDPSVVDIFLALSSGARLLIVPALLKRRPGGLAQLLFRDHRATVLQASD